MMRVDESEMDMADVPEKRNGGILARRGFLVEDWVAELFSRLGYKVELYQIISGVNVDLVIERDGIRSPVEVKSTPRFPLSALVTLAARLQSITSLSREHVSPLIVVAGHLTPQARNWAAHTFDIRVWDISELREKARPFPDLYQKLTQILDPDTVAFESSVESGPRQSDITNDLIRRLTEHEKNGGLSPTQYEELCQEVVTFLFDPDLYGFERQARTSDGANRYDFICRIRPGNLFWDSLRADFRTRSILFECKNYEDRITADQVYSTERYLFSGALRTVCFLISRKGPDEGCKRSAQGALRESGKLVLLLSNIDLVEMLQLRTEQGGPTSYLDQKIWQFIITLPR
jgi:hypothetical protein